MDVLIAALILALTLALVAFFIGKAALDSAQQKMDDSRKDLLEKWKQLDSRHAKTATTILEKLSLLHSKIDFSQHQKYGIYQDEKLKGTDDVTELQNQINEMKEAILELGMRMKEKQVQKTDDLKNQGLQMEDAEEDAEKKERVHNDLKNQGLQMEDAEEDNEKKEKVHNDLKDQCFQTKDAGDDFGRKEKVRSKILQPCERNMKRTEEQHENDDLKHDQKKDEQNQQVTELQVDRETNQHHQNEISKKQNSEFEMKELKCVKRNEMRNENFAELLHRLIRDKIQEEDSAKTKSRQKYDQKATCDEMEKFVDGYGSKPLHKAAQDGDLEEAEWLVGSGDDVNRVNDLGRTPLHFTCEQGHTSVAKLLIEQGAEIDILDDSHTTPLQLAGEHGHLEVAKLLMEKGGDMNRVDKEGSTPLHRASKSGQVSLARMLIEAGAEVNRAEADSFRSTPLHHACLTNNLRMAELLLKSGADKTVTRRGRQALCLASLKVLDEFKALFGRF